MKVGCLDMLTMGETGNTAHIASDIARLGCCLDLGA